jgi:CSLREA domain-containing protein
MMEGAVMRITRRVVASGAVLAVAGLVTSACELPPAQLTVNTTADGVDADPGDGVCETAAGNGVCTLRAAVAEGNALGQADLVVPAGTYPLSVVDGDGSADLDVTGRIELNWLAPAEVEIGGSIDVAASGTLLVDGATIAARVTVAGSLVANRSGIGVFSGALSALSTIHVTPDGDALVTNSVVGGWSSQRMILNEGTLNLLYTTVSGIPYSGTPMLETATGASSHLTATRFTATASFHGAILPDYSGMPACEGPVVSHGYNTTLNDSCGLDQPGDTEQGGANAWVDRIPAGVLDCGVTALDDWEGNPRPTDGNGDGTAACDTGGIEVPAA